ncbi:MAG TPA: tetratricopeptide repeat protein [Steroidobacteraceae bacterium]|jgi:tetratricopeptide (TPR) repeat protein|nr:tetratricopeptide repeat protein [Steroidobacteraceae bacterium]
MNYKYNPGFLSDEEIIRKFVVRQKDFRILREILRENTHASSNRHVLVIGPRGSGKSTLARRLVAEVRQDEILRSDWYPIVLAEESYGVTSPGEFWLECVFQLSEHSGRLDVATRYRELKIEQDEARLRELALGALISFAARMQCRFLLVVENLNQILDEQMDAQQGWEIRHALQNVPEIMLLATATKRFDSIENAKDALFEQFKVHELRPLTLSDVSALWGGLTDERLRRSKSRPIQILTGGSPRLVVILAEFAVSHSFANLMSQLNSLVDQYTDYFKSQLDALASAERKVFVTVLEKWDPATTREVAESARVSVNTTSAQLSRLRSRGAVHRRISNGSQYWEASERLFNLYYLMRRRGAPSSRVNALVRFMTVYYGREQLYERATDLARECGALDPKLRQDHYFALEQIIPKLDEERRAALLSQSPPEFAKRFEIAVAGQHRKENATPKGDRLSVRKRILELVQEGDAETATKLLEECEGLSKEDSALLALVGFSNGLNSGDFGKAHELVGKALELDSSVGVIWYFRGLLLRAQDLHREAIGALKNAIERGNDDADAWLALGDSHAEMAEKSEAEASYRFAIAKDRDHAHSWLALGCLLATQIERLDEAEEALRTAVKLKPDEEEFLGALGKFLLEKRGDASSAQNLFRSIVLRDSTGWRGWMYLIRALSEGKRSSEEIAVQFRTAMETPGLMKRWKVSYAYAEHLSSVREDKRAERVLQEATSSDPESGEAWFQYARLLSLDLDNHKLSMQAYKRALDLEPNEGYFWSTFGNYLTKQGEHLAEAEEAYRKATKVSPNECGAWRTLGDHLVERERHEEARQYFEKALSVNPRCGCAVAGYSSILARGEKGFDEVDEMIREFIARVPEIPGPHVALAKYMFSLRQDRQGAIKEYLKALKKGATPSALVESFIDVLDLSEFSHAVESLASFLEASREGDEEDIGNLIAWTLYLKQAKGELLEYALSLAQESVNRLPGQWERRHTLASLQFVAGRNEESFAQIRWLADQILGGSLEAFIDLCIAVARGGEGDILLGVLSNSRSRETFEPMIVALQFDQSKEEPRVAREVLEVARDIHRQIVEDKNATTHQLDSVTTSLGVTGRI